MMGWYICEACGDEFKEPIEDIWREDMNGEGAFETFCELYCPHCGSDRIREWDEEDDDELDL